MDIKSSAERSKNMAAIRNKDTKPEVYLRKKLFARGYRYRKNVNYIYGHPDIYLAKYKTVIFVHGCYWHRHPGCKFAYTPKSRTEFWNAKFASNIERDRKVQEELMRQGVRVIVVWECMIRSMEKDSYVEEQKLSDIISFLNQKKEKLLTLVP